jgi:hypothetical protein
MAGALIRFGPALFRYSESTGRPRTIPVTIIDDAKCGYHAYTGYATLVHVIVKFVQTFSYYNRSQYKIAIAEEAGKR